MFSHPKKCFLLSDLLPSVQLLHDSLVLYEKNPSLLSLVANLCEDWWKEKILGRETLISQTLPYVLSKSLSNGKKVDVKKVYLLREAFLLFDYVDESIEDMRVLLIRCVIAPVYLKTDEGRKFIAFMMGLNERILKESLDLIKSQIVFGRKSVLEAYGEILFRAWKGIDPSLRHEIEDGFLQGLIDSAIHANSKPLACSIRRVLGGFIEQRATEGVEKLLFRLSEPLLFRSLQVANSNVRQNALHLFLDLFPLEDPDVTKEVKDALLDRQFFLLDRMLSDDCPDIRATAVEGSCRIMYLFWEVIPSSTITKFLTKIIDSMSHDMCNETRLSTVNGIIYLIENPQSHEILKVLIPRLGFMIRDSTLSVRIAVIDLLLSIRDLQTFQFNKVVNMEDLLSCLANDHARVAQRITQLLLPSYFPSKMNLKEACGRCIALIKRSPLAGARFCEFALSEGSSYKSLLELLKVCVTLIITSKNLKSEQISGLFMASAKLCCSLSTELPNKMVLAELFPDSKLKSLLSVATSQSAKAAVLTIVSVVSSDNSTFLHDMCISAITNCTGIDNNLETQYLVRAAHNSMISNGWVEDLFGVLMSSLQRTALDFIDKNEMESSEVVQSLKKKINKMPAKSTHSNRKGKANMGMSKMEENLSNAAGVAWQMKELLMNADAKSALLKSPNLKIVVSALRIISRVSIEQYSRWECLDSSAIIAYLAISMQISLQNMSNKDEGPQDASMVSTPVVIEDALIHLLSCVEKFFSKPIIEKSCFTTPGSKNKKASTNRKKRRHKDTQSTPEPTLDDEAKTDIPVSKVMLNVAKIIAPTLKFITDALTIELISHMHTRCLKFASSFYHYLLSFINVHHTKLSEFNEEDVKDILLHLKSSYSYALKLLHITLKSSSESSVPPKEVYYLSNNLLDFIVSIESSLGSKYASHILFVAKPWLSVLILGLASNHLVKSYEEEEGGNFSTFPLWLSVLGKQEDEEGLQVYKNLIEMVIALLKKGNLKVLDAVGGVIFRGVEFAFEKEEFELVIGLLKFACERLLGSDFASWNEMEIIPRYEQKVSLRIEREINEENVDEGKRQILECARDLLKLICTEPL